MERRLPSSPSQEQPGRRFGTDISVGLQVQLLQEFTSACDAKAIRAPVGRPLVESEAVEGGGAGGGVWEAW